MDSVRLILAGCFWAAAAGVVYTWLVYPVLVHVFARVFGSVAEAPGTGGAVWPRVTLLIAAHNEEAVIEARIRNALDLDYPAEALDIVIASDGSEDRTVALAGRWGARVRVLDFAPRRGKAETLNAALGHIDSEIVVFSDANTSMDRMAVRSLARWFTEPGVGAVCGRLVLRDGVGNADGVYWRYENFLKVREAALGGLLGANGAIYAIRRRDFTPLPAGTIVDDFVLPLLARMRGGGRIVYDAEAVAHEESAPDLGSEFRRRARIGAGGVQALRALWPMLGPGFGWTAFTLWSHKVFRWACPVLLLVALGSSLALLNETPYFEATLVQGAFYAVAAACAVVPSSACLPRALRVIPMFAGLNLALLVGTVRGVMGRPTGIWKRTARGASEVATA